MSLTNWITEQVDRTQAIFYTAGLLVSLLNLYFLIVVLFLVCVGSMVLCMGLHDQDSDQLLPI